MVAVQEHHLAAILHKNLPGEVAEFEGRPECGYSRFAKATFRGDRRLNIRLSSKDLETIQKGALAERLPYIRR
jgi:predicted DNA binding CopG/RHH family protein